MKINEVIIEPVLTEKATILSKDQVYMFYVNPKSSKTQIKTVLEKIYPVEIGKIRIMIRKGKKVRVGKKMTTKKLADRKVAYIKLKKGKIDLFPQA